MGFKVIIVSRSMEKMKKVKKELGDYNIELIQYDFTE
jgi:short-subunit dehydrogenase